MTTGCELEHQDAGAALEDHARPAGDEDGFRVVFGTPSLECEWPTSVSLGKCSGTLIHPEVVIYAAHCGSAHSQVYFGERVSAPARTVSTSSCEVFPGGRPGRGNDFGYCLLAEPVTDVPIVPPLMGCEVDILQPGRAVTVVGFGLDEHGVSGVKRAASPTISKIGSATSADEILIGANEVGDGQDTCNGDSGGPVFVQLDDGSYRVFGITSYGDPQGPNGGDCGDGGYYSMIHVGMEWFEARTGRDLTPCHDADGSWNPGPGCAEFPHEPNLGHSSWASGCAGGPVSGASATCGSHAVCCQPDDEPGCDDDSVTACVCAVDPFCCEDQWDGVCAAQVETLGCGACADEPPGSCEEPHDTPGCDEPEIEACVCEVDPFCCDSEWDELCVSEVESPACADADPARCCDAHGGLGCSHFGVAACVCATDSFCCDNQWDELCASEVEGLGCGACPTQPSGPCKEANGTPGCEDYSTTSCVCETDPYCCNNTWDVQCASEVESLACG